MNEELIRKVIAEVMAEVMADQKSAAPAAPSAPVSGLKITEKEKATKGTNPKEVVLAVTPGFGVHFQGTIIDVPHGEVIRQIMAGVEEEGLTCRVIRVYHTADVAFMSHYAAKLSGSGIGLGVLCRGTAIIHQKDLAPLNNLELFPQSPLLDAGAFRAIGRNAAKYAKGEQPIPVATRNDPMARPRFQGLAALLHNKEMRYLDRKRPPMEVQVEFTH
ncbi:propanediol/glycerol family dehydratase medium subunit [Aminithiophilus ramosus]|uniref:Propanediol/glycerol family dehydratase medium subunit n=2 Tax=Synergistales TaxID=649776 RepID=A0A9Q7AHJ2_9BACT|nr:propanediol/glycerol family dehydratase medium subunit [Aminithiophilus ramosus]QTX32030.1 propanediol/glycerol family dehydratase medium subunit [Aminithiophilus ramosus]QVL35872.1 propanediol/glycerol family dehydratase medium subunit [Synergistota bacterium]